MCDVEKIPNEDIVYRQVPVPRTDKLKIGRIPNETNFLPDEDGLSVHWNKYIDVKNIYLLLATSHNAMGNYINYTSFLVFQFPVDFIRSITGITDVIHNPFCPTVAINGKPTNRAHSLVVYADDVEIRIKFTDYVQSHHAEAYCKYDVPSLETEISELRKRLDDQFNNTIYSS